MHRKRLIFFLLVILILSPLILSANNGGLEENHLTERMIYLVLQLSIIIFATYIAGLFFSKKLKIPAVIGEIIAGMIIGPYLLGSYPLPYFPKGIFPLNGTSIPITPELYGIAVIGSILLLFKAGLETNLNILLYYIKSGLIIGLGGVIISFLGGAFLSIALLKLPFFHPITLLLSAATTATSVGITVRILTENNKTNSPEGVSILVAAIFDDVLGILVLAITLSIILSLVSTGSVKVPWKKIEFISIKTFSIWISATVLGILASNILASFLKKFKDKIIFSIVALGISFVIAGIMEKSGLAMIIGAYIVGLSLSKTEINYVIIDAIAPLEKFFVPIFFAVVGMLVDFKLFLKWEVLSFGLIFTVVAILGKLLGCGLPALLTGFNLLGALRIGIGMIPRGEVGLIIANVGYLYGIIDSKYYSTIIMMVLLSTILVPPILDRIFRIEKEGSVKDIKLESKTKLSYEFYDNETAELFLHKVIDMLIREGFYVTKIIGDYPIFYIRKSETFIELENRNNILEFSLTPNYQSYIRTLIYEAFLDLNRITKDLKKVLKVSKLKKGIVARSEEEFKDVSKFIDRRSIILNLKSNTKDGIIREMLDVLAKNNKSIIIDSERILNDLLERERVVSTGLEHNIAIPHCKTKGAKRIVIGIGVKKEGVNFDSIDGQPSKIFIMIIIPQDYSGPYLQILSNISSILSSEENRNIILNAKTPDEVFNIFTPSNMKS